MNFIFKTTLKSTPLKLILILVLIPIMGLAQPLDPNKQLTQYTLDTWDDEQGLPSGGVVSLLQSKDGYIWLGTFNGVFRFDGEQFTQYNKNNHPVITNNGFPTLCEDNEGNIWAGSNGGGVYVFKKDSIQKYTKENGLSSNVIRRIYKDKYGTIYIGTGNGLTIFKDGTFTSFKAFFDKTKETNNVSVSAIFRDSENIIWIGTNKGLYKFIDEKFIPVPLEIEKHGEVEILNVSENKEKELFISTFGQGVIVKRNGVFSQFPLPDDANKISSVYTDSNGSLWICHQNGLLRYYNGTISTLPSTNGTTEDAVEEVIEDREGSIWITRYNGGIQRLRDGIFNNYTIHEGLSDNIIHCIYEDTDNSKWIATVNGLNHFKNGKFELYNKANGHLIADLVRDVYRDSKGILWIGTYSGLTKIHNEKITHYTAKNGLSSDLIRVIFEDSKGQLWIGTRNGLNRYDNGTFKTYTINDGLSNNFILSIQENMPGELWIGTSGGGIAILKNEKFSKLTAENGLPSNVVFRIHKDSDNVLWIATNNGLCRYDGNFFKGFNTDNGLLNTAVFQIIEDEQGSFWITSDFGIIKVSKKELNDYVKEKNPANIREISYKQVDGLKRSECTGAAKSMLANDGKIWFATLGGVAIVDINDNSVNKIAPLVHIEKLVADQQKYDLGKTDKIELPPGTKNLELKYTGLSLKVPQKVSFKYQLTGFDDDWIDAGNRRVAYYTNLAPGNYTFKVMAANNDGIWSQEVAQLSFYIYPLFYQTSGFIWFAILILILLVMGIYQLRVRKIKKERVWLKHIVEERTKEIQQQNEEIATQRDKIEERSMKLEEAQGIIKAQNEKLKKSNVKLEDTVYERTEQLKISNVKLMETNRELDLFIYKTAHDLQGPIARILGLCQLGLTDDNPAAEKIYFEKLNYTASNMSTMLSRVIRIHNINAHQIEIEAVDLKSLTDTIAAEYKDDEKSGSRVLANNIEARFMVKTDRQLLTYALTNLIDNAFKFGHKNSEICNAQISAKNVIGEISITIRSTGDIIPDDMVTGIFDIFTVATSVRKGAGVGLYETKVIMNRLDGHINLTQSNEEATVFTLIFPDKAF